MKKRNKVLILALIFLIILISIFGTKIVLYVNFLLGNDIIVNLEPNKEFITIPHGQKEFIEFKASVTTNPFCSAVCSSEFFDISNDNIIERDEFTLKTGLSTIKSYEISSPEFRESMGLYRFSMECHSFETSFCHTSGEPTTRSVLITANFTLNEKEKELKNGLKEKINNLSGDIGTLINNTETIQKALDDAVRIDVEDINNKILIIKEDSLSLKKEFLSLEDDWKGENYYLIDSKVQNINTSFMEINDLFGVLDNETRIIISEYNSLIDKLTESRSLLDDFRIKASEENEGIIFDRIIEFNVVVEKFSNNESIENKSLVVNEIYEKVNNIFNITGNITIETNLSEFNFNKISIEDYAAEKIEIKLEEVLPQCCVFGACSTCCVDDECRTNEDLFPIVLVHGHAISESISAEYSLEGFNNLQKRMEEDGYLNAGTITIYNKEDTPYGYLGVAKAPITIRASYYFDVFKEPENYVVVQRKSENIDTYAVRLKEVLDTITIKTGRDKVNIIAFSMGGLVTRRYLQIFGDEKVDKVILIGTPNKGISGDVKIFCPIVGGGELECRDMNEDSLFMNKLNKGAFPDIKIHNIVGTGCNTGDGIGDGIVLEKNAVLENASNYIFNGTCKSLVEPFHLWLHNADRNPEIYNTIKRILENDSSS